MLITPQGLRVEGLDRDALIRPEFANAPFDSCGDDLVAGVDEQDLKDGRNKMSLERGIDAHVTLPDQSPREREDRGERKAGQGVWGVPAEAAQKAPDRAGSRGGMAAGTDGRRRHSSQRVMSRALASARIVGLTRPMVKTP